MFRFNFFDGIPIPKSQNQEVLYCLIKKQVISRKQMMADTGILNLTARISDLRDLGLKIKCIDREVTNKFGRKTKYGLWRLEDKEKAKELYHKLAK